MSNVRKAGKFKFGDIGGWMVVKKANMRQNDERSSRPLLAFVDVQARSARIGDLRVAELSQVDIESRVLHVQRLIKKG